MPTARPPRTVPQPRTPADHQLRLVVGEAAAAPRTGRNDQHDFAHRIAQAVVDVLAGHRPATQLVRWARPDVFEALRARSAISVVGAHSRSATPLRRPVVRSVRTCRVSETAIEAAAVIVESERVRALAMRLEGLHGRWRLTALIVG